jgi:hypothetical protein
MTFLCYRTKVGLNDGLWDGILLMFPVTHFVYFAFLLFPKAPNSVVSERVRQRRNISEDDKYLLAANSSAVTRQRFADILEYVNPEVGYTFSAVTQQRFADILEYVNPEVGCTILCCHAATLRRYSRIC